MGKKKTRKERKEIIFYIQEQMVYLEDTFAPSISKSIDHIKKKFDLGDIDFKYRINWKMKVSYDK